MSKRNKAPSTPAWTVIHNDCVAGFNNEVTRGSVDLLVADPPYNYGMEYDTYADNKSWDAYMEWSNVWLTAAVASLHKHGSMWLFMPDELAADIDVMCRRTFKLYRRAWVVWYYTFGVASAKNFARSHTHLLYYTRTKSKFTFNESAIRVPSARQAIYNDKRQNPAGKLPDNTWALHRKELEPLFAPDMDTWLESRICGTFKERKKHSPNQLPLPLVERIILSCSLPDQLVVDPFVGTGTTGVAAVKHGRRFLGMDVSGTCADASRSRITSEAVNPPVPVK